MFQRFTTLLLFVAILSIINCTSSTIYVSKDVDVSSSSNSTSSSVSKSETSSAVPTSDIRGKIITTAKSYIKAKYKHGGLSKKGIDCSGLVYNSYLNGINMKLPRSSVEQYKNASATSNPKPGDLVFFKMSSWFSVDHVGVYIGNNRMIHASPTYGVIEVSLNKDYYQQRLVGFGSFIK